MLLSRPTYSWCIRVKIARCAVCKYHGIVVEASFDWKPVECAEERDEMRELGKVENQADCWISCRGLMAQAGSPANSELQ